MQRIRVLHPTAVSTGGSSTVTCFGYAERRKKSSAFAVCVVTQSNTPTSIVTIYTHQAKERVQEALTSGERERIEVSGGLGRERPTTMGRTAQGTMSC